MAADLQMFSAESEENKVRPIFDMFQEPQTIACDIQEPVIQTTVNITNEFQGIRRRMMPNQEPDFICRET